MYENSIICICCRKCGEMRFLILPSLASMYLIEMDFWSKIRPKMVNIEVFERKRIMRACARNFFLDKIYFLILFRIIVGARAPASAPAFFGVALRLALRGNFRSCAPTALRLLGTPLRSGAPRSAAFQYSANHIDRFCHDLVKINFEGYTTIFDVTIDFC